MTETVTEENCDTKMMERVERLETELLIAKRKITNATSIGEAHERFAEEALERETKCREECQSYRCRMDRTQEKLYSLERHMQIERLSHSREKDMRLITVIEKEVRELRCDPSLSIPISSGKRRRLNKLENNLCETRLRYRGQQKLLNHLRDRQTLDAEMRLAALTGNAERVRSLIKKGVSVNAADDIGLSAFKYACGQSSVSVVQLMLPLSDVNDIDGGLAPIHAALINCNEAIVQLLVDSNADLEQRDDSGSAPLHVACKKGHLGCVSVIAKGGASINAIDSLGNTCLHFCAAKKFGDIANFLIENGADSKIKNIDGLSPWTVARIHKSYDVIKAINELIHH